MKFDLHEKYREYPTLPEQEILFVDLLGCYESRLPENLDKVADTFWVLCEKHWHLYLRPTKKVKLLVESWVTDVWKPSLDERSDSVFYGVQMLGMVELFEKMIAQISACSDGETKRIFLDELDKHMTYVQDPWHSMCHKQ